MVFTQSHSRFESGNGSLKKRKMRSIEELREYVKTVAWQHRYISTAGVVPESVAWELIKEIEERERDLIAVSMASGSNPATEAIERMKCESETSQKKLIS